MWLKGLWQDVRYGLRTMRRSPVFTVMAVLSLALGIGANTAIFGLLDQIAFRLLPVRNPEELRIIGIRERSREGLRAKPTDGVSYPLYVRLRDESSSFQALAGIGTFQWKDKSVSTDNAWRGGHLVSGNYFEVLGVTPTLGVPLLRPTIRLKGGWPQWLGRDAQLQLLAPRLPCRPGLDRQSNQCQRRVADYYRGHSA
jgi:putative ABC transport system permease protein